MDIFYRVYEEGKIKVKSSRVQNQVDRKYRNQSWREDEWPTDFCMNSLLVRVDREETVLMSTAVLKHVW